MIKKILPTLKKGCKFYYFFPLIIVLCLFKLIPFISAVVTSFKQQYNYLTGDYNGLGIENYTKIFKDEFFFQALGNTAIYVIFVVVLVMLIGLPIAWCLYRTKKGSAFFQTAIFLPFVTSDIAVGLSWRLMFNDKGIINFLLGGANIGWLTDANMSLITLIIFGVWSSLPLAILIYLCAMLNLDNNVINAARADGASDTKIFFKVIIPNIMPTILMTIITSSISAWLEMNALFPLFSGEPGPYYNVFTMVYYIYNKMQEGRYAFGLACAASVMLFLCISVFLLLRYFLSSKNKKKQRRHYEQI